MHASDTASFPSSILGLNFVDDLDVCCFKLDEAGNAADFAVMSFSICNNGFFRSVERKGRRRKEGRDDGG